MRPIFKRIIISTILRDQVSGNADVSSYQLSKAFMQFKTLTIRMIKDVMQLLLGISFATLGLRGFLMPNEVIDGGATGMALLAREITGTKLAVWLVLINLPFVFLGSQIIGREFAIKTVLAIIGLALCVTFIEVPRITEDKLLVGVFGGICLGAGIGLAIRGGAVIDGTEVLAIYLSRKLGTTIGDIIILINLLVFSAAAYLLSVETALYSMITYLSAAKTMDFVIEGIEEYIGVNIISLKHVEIRNMIINKMGRGVTVYPGTHGYGRSGNIKDTNVLYTVITRLELSKLNAEIERIDKDAFVVMTSIKDTKGGMIKKRRLKH
ncbi:YitT family protein [Segetibacter sp. 3557_3]|uniref:YitT family protein n=1 Tax=Segetibacter sp. 3557_3 TaxID=2547429 RepID=UPI001058DA81|nr:YitT family protein [Segetibacter sp. 3557_3]TDH26484.1 YitT family protein [Segetibacter sp. 3557_3]